MPAAEKLGLAVCRRLEEFAARITESCGLEDVVLLPWGRTGDGGACRTLDGELWAEFESAAAARAGECEQFRLLAGPCVDSGGGAAGNGEVVGRPLHVARVCPGPGGPGGGRWEEEFRLGLVRCVLLWRLEFQRQRLNAMLASVCRRLTDYTMMQELVGALAETLAEEKVVEKVFDLFTALLAPGSMVFASMDEGKLERAWSRPLGLAELPEVRARLTGFRRAYCWTESGNGFRISLRHRSRTLGVLEVEGISFAEYKEHYLDLALVVARVCGMAISNARLYRELKGPGRAYLEFAEDLRDALAARKRAEEKQVQLMRQLEAANQELNDFAYVVSHDLKAPLRAIDSLAHWLATDYAEKFDDEGRQQLALLMGRVKRMAGLIDGILQYSRAGRIREELVDVNLAEVVPEVIDLLAPPAHIRVVVETPLPVVKVERTRIEQVFQNFLSNALKYMDKPEGVVRVGCVEEKMPGSGETGTGFWKLYVADNGPGIAEKDFQRVWQLFQTLQPRDRADSTGVGLAVVKKSVEMYGGRVWLESELGKGSTFWFTLPKAESGPAQKAEGS